MKLKVELYSCLVFTEFRGKRREFRLPFRAQQDFACG